MSGNVIQQHSSAQALSQSATMDALELHLWRTRQEAFWLLVSRIVQLNDVSMMLCAVLDHLEELFQCASCAIFLMDSNESKMCRVVKRAMHNEGFSFTADLPRKSGLVAQTIQNRMSVQLVNFASLEAYDPSVDLPQELPGQTLLSAPLSSNGLVYATIQLTNRKCTTSQTPDGSQHKESNWKGWETELISWLGCILNSCIRRTIDLHDVSLSERTQKALLNISSSASTEGTVLNLIEGVISGASHITKAERISLFMIDWETRQLWTLASSNHGENLRVSLDNSVLGFAATTMKVINITDPDKDERFAKAEDTCPGLDVHSALYVPIGTHECMRCFDKEEILGVLEVLNKDGGEEFTLDDEYAFEAFACEVAVILRRKRSEIDCIKLLTGTQSEKKLVRRRNSQINLLECLTSYPSTLRSKMTDHIRHSFKESRALSCDIVAPNAVYADESQRNVSMSACSDKESIIRQRESTCEGCSGHPNSTSTIPGWDFNIFVVESDSLIDYAHRMCMVVQMDQKLRIDSDTIWNFIYAVKTHYHPNPYHSFLHAVGVLHATYMILTTTQAPKLLTSLDIVGCLIAALCHDIDHPGHSNSYEIMAGTHLAMLYSDNSVLEHHHAFTTFHLLTKKEEVNVLKNLDPTEYRYIRKVIITAILGTDMAKHFNLCEKLDQLLHPTSGGTSSLTRHTQREQSLKYRSSCSSLLAPPIESSKKTAVPIESKTNQRDRNHSTQIINAVRGAVYYTDLSKGSSASVGIETKVADLASEPSATKTDTSSRQDETASNLDEHSRATKQFPQSKSLDDRLFLIKTIVHASDLSGQVYTRPVALKWSNLIAKEFANQALMESAENMPVSYTHLDDPLEMVEGQLFFLQKLVAPLWRLMQQIFPELQVCNRNLAQNLSHYEHELKRLRSCQSQSPESSQADESKSNTTPIRPKSVSTATEESTAKGDDMEHSVEDCGKGISEEETMKDLSNMSGSPEVKASTSTPQSKHVDAGTEGRAVAGVVKSTPARFNSFLLPHQLTDLQATECCHNTLCEGLDNSERSCVNSQRSEEILQQKKLERDMMSGCYNSFSSRSSISSISEGSVEEISERDIETI
uniref:Phosphodiesterase n=1 Tax=Albugo laibachii Nc14 TaxID=890382 RepID=F0VZF6_9STRA|nr:3'5'cyclic nucleotide phosphodiesterase putative [Albugo laibachii Nc14]|eukprot:CCA14186.1 3'5'cyclic nucleotide phosphodiesterase putative [Albugo laibachii Nc14]